MKAKLFDLLNGLGPDRLVVDPKEPEAKEAVEMILEAWARRQA